MHSVPLGKLVVLDLFAEVKPIWITSEQFYGVPYIWKVIVPIQFLVHTFLFSLIISHLLVHSDLNRCMLHNFAGNIEMYGVLDAVASGPINACTSQNSTMVSFIHLNLTFCLKKEKRKKKVRSI